jgi:diguanylate cyclase (GGDEF)-like protein
VGVHSPLGMAATDRDLHYEPVRRDGRAYLRAAELDARVEEEVHRAKRHGTSLSCLLLVVENLHELAGGHDGDLYEQTLDYLGRALARELRDFDRVGRPSGRELAIVLPGADSVRGEIVARRMLERLRTIKVEADGERRPLRLSLGLASWRTERSGEELLARARAVAHGANGEDTQWPGAQAEPFVHWQARLRAQSFESEHPEVGRLTR